MLTAEPGNLAGEFDLVMADVPCSNTGVFRRRPDALWRFDHGELTKIAALQHSILDAAAARVAPGGQLVYSTCSIEPEENDRQMEAFTAEHPDFSLGGREFLLPCREHDGAYACLLRRSSRSIRR
ncbi:Ribosomal RNA small subunit methyltransferase B [bioreactor metagenome]|uniref:Ribosomal RNA small subunit methyltransferase B n=1 Tax=bioreactor metagenome TaxID=1076179 RepID=A0A645GNR9_9ZZZZ